MKVAFHAGQLLQDVPGGIGRYSQALLNRLPAAGVDVVAFAAGDAPANLPDSVEWCDLGAPRGPLRYELWHRFRRPALPMRADIVHAPSLAIPPPGAAALVVTVHDVSFLRMPHVTTRQGERFHRRGLELARREARVVIVPSEFTRRELEQEGFAPERLHIARFGVDPPRERAPADIDAVLDDLGISRPYVLTVGTVEPRKDLETIVRAVEAVRARHPDLTLVVNGPRGWGVVHGLDRPFVRVLGTQPWSVVDALYRRAAVCCIASLYEGFGLPALEAMVRGTATIAASGSATEEVMHDGGLVFDRSNPDACAAAIERVLDDDELRLRLRAAGPLRASDLTWERTIAEHLHAYEQATTS
ncbi:MAG TPA: glycosyltransferase family 1 protein [Acidimicrobiia bacterium]|nr:glycosyltransferase family 1 protein [Acidimicrobiia bacterium]